MFLIKDSENEPYGGMFHRILDQHGHSHLLNDIDQILESSVGEITLGDYIRIKRNKMATHGEGRFSSQPEFVQNISFDEDALDEFNSSMAKL